MREAKTEREKEGESERERERQRQRERSELMVERVNCKGSLQNILLVPPKDTKRWSKGREITLTLTF